MEVSSNLFVQARLNVPGLGLWYNYCVSSSRIVGNRFRLMVEMLSLFFQAEIMVPDLGTIQVLRNTMGEECGEYGSSQISIMKAHGLNYLR